MAMIVEPQAVDFERPGVTHYQVAFPLDGTWGYSLVPLTVVNGALGRDANGVLVFGGRTGTSTRGRLR